MNKEAKIRIQLEHPVKDVVYGLQKGKGNDYEIVQPQLANNADLIFEMNVDLKVNSKGEWDFAGPFVQGKPGERFIYIGIGTYARQLNTPWSRRLKIPLTGISQDVMNKLTDETVLHTKVPGTGKDGGPNCATVKPFNGWTLAGSN